MDLKVACLLVRNAIDTELAQAAESTMTDKQRERLIKAALFLSPGLEGK